MPLAVGSDHDRSSTTLETEDVAHTPLLAECLLMSAREGLCTMCALVDEHFDVARFAEWCLWLVVPVRAAYLVPSPERSVTVGTLEALGVVHLPDGGQL